MFQIYVLILHAQGGKAPGAVSVLVPGRRAGLTTWRACRWAAGGGC